MSTKAGEASIAPPAPAPGPPQHNPPRADPRQVRARTEQALILARQLLARSWELTAELNTQRQLLAQQRHSAQQTLQHLHQRQCLLQYRSGQEMGDPGIGG